MQQIFISYRRDGGEALAQLLFDRFSELGFSVFYDIESLTSGQFDTKIYSKIEECDDFILVLPPSALDRCTYDEDWVRREIRHALKFQKNIIPVMMRGFVFPKDLPPDISDVTNKNGVSFQSMEYLEARIEKITSMLVSKPTGVPSKLGSSKKVEIDKDHVPVIVNIMYSIGSNDVNDAWPQGEISSIINIDEFSVIQFQVRLSNIPKGSKTINQNLKIYHSQNGLVYYDSSEFDWRDEWDKFSTGWIIRGDDGGSVPLGKYTAEFWVNDSNVYIYNFEIISNKGHKGFLARFFRKK